MVVFGEGGYFENGVWYQKIHSSFIGKNIIREYPCQRNYGLDYSLSLRGKFDFPRMKDYVRLCEICDDGSLVYQHVEETFGYVAFGDKLYTLGPDWNDGHWILLEDAIKKYGNCPQVIIKPEFQPKTWGDGTFVKGVWYHGITPLMIGKEIIRSGPCHTPWGNDYSYSMKGCCDGYDEFDRKIGKDNVTTLLRIESEGSLVVKTPYLSGEHHLESFWDDGRWMLLEDARELIKREKEEEEKNKPLFVKLVDELFGTGVFDDMIKNLYKQYENDPCAMEALYGNFMDNGPDIFPDDEFDDFPDEEFDDLIIT